MSMILHDWNLDRKLHLIQSAYDALPAGGALISIEPLIDDARRTDAFGLLMSLNMLIEFGDAFGYTGRDFTTWCQQVGFQHSRDTPTSRCRHRSNRTQIARMICDLTMPIRSDCAQPATVSPISSSTVTGEATPTPAPTLLIDRCARRGTVPAPAGSVCGLRS